MQFPVIYWVIFASGRARNAVSRHSSIQLLQRAMIRRSGAAMEAATEALLSCKESRVLIARLPFEESCEVAVDTESCLIHLKNPKTGAKACYLLTGDVLQEVHWFKEQFSSWFLGNHVLEDGSLYVGTPMDPIFLLLPILDEARMKKAEDDGKFRSLEEILYVEGYPGYQQFSCLLGDALDAVCEVREIGTSKFYRLDDFKVLSWLCCKVKNTMKGLSALEGFGSMLDGAKEVQAVGLIGDYLKDSGENGYREKGSSSQDRQPILIIHEVGESSGQAEEAFHMQLVTDVTLFKQLMENPRFLEF
ncbi:hypothetical protein L7F22_048089 [Adiantum nelumboides]|nr:hypothetical protein [Adiantum nelumboides]